MMPVHLEVEEHLRAGGGERALAEQCRTFGPLGRLGLRLVLQPPRPLDGVVEPRDELFLRDLVVAVRVRLAEGFLERSEVGRLLQSRLRLGLGLVLGLVLVLVLRLGLGLGLGLGLAARLLE